MPLQGTYNVYLVSISFLVAILAAYTALRLIPRIKDLETEEISFQWIGLSALVLGAGIWAMHFIGMLAYKLPIEVGYDIGETALSLLIPILISAAGLYIAFREDNILYLVTGGIVIGAGIAMMHYIGMDAMHMHARMVYDVPIVVLSVVIAIGSAIASLWMARVIQLEVIELRRLGRLVSACLMGFAITGMHYVGMAAVEFFPDQSMHQEAAGFIFGSDNMVFGITVVVVVILLAIQTIEYTSRINKAYKKLLVSDQALQASMRELGYQKQALDKHAIVSIADPKGIITYVNEKFCEVSKYQQEELLGENHRILNSGTHSSEFWQTMWQTITRGQVWQDEVCNRNKHGDLYWVETTIVPFMNEQGEPWQYVSIRTEITGQKQNEDILRQAKEQAEAGERAKRDFLSLISHEFRTPLNGVLGGLQLLENTNPTDEQRDYLEIAVNSGQRMLDLVDSVLDYLRVEHDIEFEFC